MPTAIMEKQETKDLMTGEITESTERVYSTTRLPEEPKFIKLYLNAWCAFKDIKGVNNSFLFQCLQYMTYAAEQQVISFSPFIKKQIARNLNWSEKTALNRCNLEIRKLTKANIFKSLGDGAYQVNPQLVGKGYWKDIYKLQATFNVLGEKQGTVDVKTERKQDIY